MNEEEGPSYNKCKVVSNAQKIPLGHECVKTRTVSEKYQYSGM